MFQKRGTSKKTRKCLAAKEIEEHSSEQRSFKLLNNTGLVTISLITRTLGNSACRTIFKHPVQRIAYHAENVILHHNDSNELKNDDV